MTVGFRHGDPRFPFFWESPSQPPARWHGADEGPVQYLADTPDGAWAEFLRHEGITDIADLDGIRRRLWAVELDTARENERAIAIDPEVSHGDTWSYPLCQDAARRMRREGATCLRAGSAALQAGTARGQVTDGGLREAADRDGVVWVLIGLRPTVRGWVAVDVGAPTERVLGLVVHFGAAGAVPPADRTEAATRTSPASGGRRSGERRSQADRRSMVDLTRLEAGEPERRAAPGIERRSTVDRRSEAERRQEKGSSSNDPERRRKS